MHDSSTCPLCRGLPANGSMSDEQFFDFLAACREELETKQAAFQRQVADVNQWSYDMADETLTLDDMRFGMTPIGSYSKEYQTWLWAWANDGFPEVARAAARRIQSLYDLTGFQVFLDPGIPADAEDAQDLAAMAIHQLGAIGQYRFPSETRMLYLAVHEARE